jgi:ornithine cyclodeaminase/alanine dehydrogenase-like protein (mu-crystallin family)
LIPIASGEWRADQLFADLGELCSGAKTVAYKPGQITFFKSNGLAVEDIAAASAVLAA